MPESKYQIEDVSGISLKIIYITYKFWVTYKYIVTITPNLAALICSCAMLFLNQEQQTMLPQNEW